MSESTLPPLQPYFPTTFLERGVTMPFTTPRLFGARGRPSRDAGLELILPNPSGGRGVYVLNWGKLSGYCRPTVHDRHLITNVAALTTITPRTIRRTATEIAAAGMAGEDAMTVALHGIEAERDEMIVGNYMLLTTLVDQLGPTSPTAASSAKGTGQNVEQRAQHAVAQIAARMEKSPAWVASSLESLSDILRPIGIRAQTSPTQVRRTLDLLRTVRAEISEWGLKNADTPLGNYAGMIGAVADLTVSLTSTMVEQVNVMTDETIKLLQTWSDDPDSVIRVAAQPEWMLDGWEQICLLWRQARHNAAERAALAEIVALVPVLPREVIDWAGLGRDGDALNQLRRYVPLNEDWRTGATVFELISRNEQLRAAGA